MREMRVFAACVFVLSFVLAILLAMLSVVDRMGSSSSWF